MTVKEATGVPPICTAVIPVKFVPVMVNCPEFAHMLVGLTFVIDGAFEDHAKKSSPSREIGPGAKVGVVINPVAGKAPPTP